MGVLTVFEVTKSVQKFLRLTASSYAVGATSWADRNLATRQPGRLVDLTTQVDFVTWDVPTSLADYATCRLQNLKSREPLDVTCTPLLAHFCSRALSKEELYFTFDPPRVVAIGG